MLCAFIGCMPNFWLTIHDTPISVPCWNLFIDSGCATWEAAVSLCSWRLMTDNGYPCLPKGANDNKKGGPFSQEVPFRIALRMRRDDFAGAGCTQSINHPAVNEKVGKTSNIQTKWSHLSNLISLHIGKPCIYYPQCYLNYFQTSCCSLTP